MTFTLTIELGNEAMGDFRDVAAALREVAERIRLMGPPREGDERKIMDTNGNTVGGWEVTP